MTAESETKEEPSANEHAPRSKHFLQSMDTLILDTIDGHLLSDASVSRLYTDDNSIKVIYRTDFDPRTTTRVALISGGGSGHEPSHAGFVGKGLLTAAVAGEVFSSPPTKAVLFAIEAVTGTPGALLIIKQYTGDVLNFTLAAKQAMLRGFNVQYVVVDDDCALLRTQSTVGRRGVAGTMFVHKIAGYFAEQERSLREIHAIITSLLDNGYLGSIGLAATTCYLPGQKQKEERMQESEVELGIGIHGEPGTTIKFGSICNLLPQMINILCDGGESRNYMPFLSSQSQSSNDTNHENENDSHNNNVLVQKKDRIAVLLNNLGGVTPIEMGIIKLYLVKHLVQSMPNIAIERVFVGPFMTSLDMRGFSVSILKIETDEILTALDFDVSPVAWIKGMPINASALETPAAAKMVNASLDFKARKKTQAQTDGNTALLALSESGAHMFANAIKSAAEALIANEDELNRLDGLCGDADCGSTLKIGAQSILQHLPSLFDLPNAGNDNDNGNDNTNESGNCVLSEIIQFLGEVLSEIGGSSGALYGCLFVSAAHEIAQITDELSIKKAMTACLDAVRQLSAFSGAHVGDCTMVDALMPAVSIAVDDNETDIAAVLQRASAAAHIGSESCKELVAKFGRRSYLPAEAQRGLLDPGAKAVDVWIAAIASSVSN